VSIKAIPTEYKGYQMRSRLEGRWAVFFDSLGIKWEYEAEGFDIDGTWYLPDFKVTTDYGYIIWYEVKPTDQSDLSKFKKFSDALIEKQEGKAECASNKPGFGDQFVWTGEYNFQELAVALTGEPGNLLLYPGKFRMCPRCGIIEDFAIFDPNYNLHVLYDLMMDAMDHWYYCFPCDCTTPSSYPHDFEKGLLCDVRPHKGPIYYKTKEVAEKISKAINDSRSYRFSYNGNSSAN